MRPNRRLIKVRESTTVSIVREELHIVEKFPEEDDPTVTPCAGDGPTYGVAPSRQLDVPRPRGVLPRNVRR